MRPFFLVTHRWLGLAASLVLMVVSLTGAGLVWFRSRALSRLHIELGLGSFGRWAVNLATLIGALLIGGGVVLWWRRKIVTIDRTKGWRRLLFDLHHTLGIVAAAFMLVIALSGSGLMLTQGIDHRMGLDRTDPRYPTRRELRIRRLIHMAHTGGPLRIPLGILWVLGSASFAVQAVSGVLLWWKPGRGASAP